MSLFKHVATFFFFLYKLFFGIEIYLLMVYWKIILLFFNRWQHLSKISRASLIWYLHFRFLIRIFKHLATSIIFFLYTISLDIEIYLYCKVNFASSASKSNSWNPKTNLSLTGLLIDTQKIHMPCMVINAEILWNSLSFNKNNPTSRLYYIKNYMATLLKTKIRNLP